MSNITFVIQGKLNETSISNIDVCLRYGKVLFSGYTNDAPDLINAIKKISSENENVGGVLSPPIENPEHNNQNIYLQGYTTLAGLRHVDTELAIKVRSDEKYENWTEFIQKLQDNKDKYNTTNLFFRPDFRYKLHPSDHVIGSYTKLLNLTFANLLTNIVSIKNISAEQKIFTAFLLSKGVDLKDADLKQITADNCVITNFTKFDKYIMRYNSSIGKSVFYTEKSSFRENEKYIYLDTLESIKSLQFL